MASQTGTSGEVLPGVDLLVGHPGGAGLVQDHLTGVETARAFLGPSHERLASYQDKAEEVDGRFDRAARMRAVEALGGLGGPHGDRLRRFADEGGYVVTTGQQPGLFGGPLYSIYKGLTAVRLAEALEEQLGRPVLPVFWVASDDHDWAEANHADIVGVDNVLHRIELEAPDPSITPPLHRIPMGEVVRDRLEAFLRCLPETDFTPQVVEPLSGEFTPDATLPSAYRRMMERLLGPFGLFFTDAADPTVKRESADMLLDELGRAAEMEAVLRRSAEQLQTRGYALQVPILEGGTNVFLEGPAGRERLYVEDGGFRLRTSGALLSADEIAARQADDPTVLSPNVLLRPVVESAIFPTLAYVGGPGEMAYFAQLGDYFAAHGIRRPVVFPRWSVTAVEGKIRKVLDKFQLEPVALGRPFHEIAQAVAREEMPDTIRAALGRVRGDLGKGMAEVQRAVAALDPTLKGPAQHARGQMFEALDDLERKAVQAVKRESEITLAQLEKAQVHLYPRGKPAERVMNPFYFLARYGTAFLEALHHRFEVRLG